MSDPDLQSELSDLFEVDEQDGPDPALIAARRRLVRRALITVTVVMTVALASIVGYVFWALNAPLPSPVANTRSLEAPTTQAATFALPAEGATAVAVTGAPDYLGADGVRLTAGDDGARSIASISKVITALVVLDAHLIADGDVGPTLTFSKADHDLYDQYYVQDAAVAEMPTGSTMSLPDALATVLIPSASNYADAVSTWAFGSRSAFLSATDDYLAREGLTGTTIVEPTGISPRNVSTPTDLLRIGQLAAANPTVARIAATTDLTLPGPGTLTNTNTLLGEGGVTGLKTGNLGEGTFSLLFTATLDGGIGEPLAVTGVTLGGESRASQDAAVLRLLDSIRAGFHDVPLVEADTLVGSYTTAWGASAQLVVADAASIRTWSDTPITLTTDISNPTEFRDGVGFRTRLHQCSSSSALHLLPARELLASDHRSTAVRRDIRGKAHGFAVSFFVRACAMSRRRARVIGLELFVADGEFTAGGDSLPGRLASRLGRILGRQNAPRLTVSRSVEHGFESECFLYVGCELPAFGENACVRPF